MRLQRIAPTLLAASLLLALAGCAGGPGTSIEMIPSQHPDSARSQADTRSLPGEAFPGDSGLSGSGLSGSGLIGSGSSDPSAAGRSIIQNGELSLEVADPAHAATQAAGIAEDLGGSVESENRYRASAGDPARALLVLRIPAESLDDAFQRLAELGTVLSQSRSAEDVTAQHVDLQARVDALEGSLERLTELMSGAATTGELIEAETALTQRQQELDALKAQLAHLEGQVEQSSISVSLSERSALPGGPASFWDGLLAGWESIVAAGAGALVIAGILLPWLALAGILALAILLIVRAARRRRRVRVERSDADSASAPPGVG